MDWPIIRLKRAKHFTTWPPDKYADDTYLIIPAWNADSCAAEIADIEEWALDNNLRLNRAKSVEIVFVPPRSRRSIVIPPRAVAGFEFRNRRVDKGLGVTISWKFSVVQPELWTRDSRLATRLVSRFGDSRLDSRLDANDSSSLYYIEVYCSN